MKQTIVPLYIIYLIYQYIYIHIYIYIYNIHIYIYICLDTLLGPSVRQAPSEIKRIRVATLIDFDTFFGLGSLP